jgi:hypothetical protein
MLRVSTTGVTSQGYSFLKVAKATGSDIAATPPFIPVAATNKNVVEPMRFANLSKRHMTARLSQPPVISLCCPVIFYYRLLCFPLGPD